MKLLALDTSTEQVFVAVFDGDTVYEEHCSGLKQQAQQILPMIERVLSVSTLALTDLDGIVFGQGPGSFTGLRVGCSVAKGLAYAADLPLYGVGGLQAISHQARQLFPDVGILSMLDARMSEIYWAYTPKDSAIQAPHVSAAFDVDITPEPVVLAGVGFEGYVASLPDVVQSVIVEQRVLYPTAASLIDCVLCEHIAPLDVSLALPIYVRDHVT